MKKRFIPWLALLLVSTMLFAGCKSEKTQGSESKAPTSEVDPNTSAEDIYADLPQGNFDNQEFVILNNISNYAITTMDTDDITIPINAAIFSRNQYVEDSLNISIRVNELGYDENRRMMDNLVTGSLGGENEYDICYNESWAQAILAQKGVYQSVNSYSKYLNFDKPWWYSNAMQELSVYDNLFYVVGDMQLMWYESIWALAFNTNVLSKHGITSPYDDVQDNTWTFERLYEIVSKTNQEGTTPNHYGIASHITFASAMLCAADIRICLQDEAEGLVLSDFGSRFVDVCDELRTNYFLNNSDNGENLIRTAYDSESWTTGKFAKKEFQWAFQEGRATFLGGTIGDMRLYVAGKEIPYGIVPLPKYDSAQEQYISYVYEGGALCGIPMNLGSEERLARVCTVMEWLCAISHKTVKPVYYDVILQGRIANDPVSAEMLNIILGLTDQGITRLELDNIFKLGTAAVIQRRISDNLNVASGIRSSKPLIEKNLDNVITAFKPVA